ncbi:NAD(P)/FAD-dependent oxidoreductase [Massilistercora timonensis]|uniref:NAD(P)/FAD-dependent oxidoreductase n=1 Tax=Massilistercora timonensis TaxID=2086584 RepID=UPI003AB6345E
MIQIQQIKLKIPHKETDVKKKFCKILHIPEKRVRAFRILKRSLDARRKPELFYVYTAEAEVEGEKALRKRFQKNGQITFRAPLPDYAYQAAGTEKLSHRPVIVGTGPAGLFCGYALARMGYRPILLERGAPVEERKKDVEEFWRTGALCPESNVQFGEGGAGTFSDGKLNTLVHDPDGRGREVLRLFASHGAPEEILYDSKPHVGTDKLIQVVRSLREEIQDLGGEFRFYTKMTGILTREEGESGRHVQAVEMEAVNKPGEKEILKTDLLILAIGHSARDTFAMLESQRFPMEAKSFAVGVRVQHPQAVIDASQYGECAKPETVRALPAAAYKLTANLDNGRGGYTFCMCPGGYVVNASSEPGHLAVNGMSYSGRSGENANSAVIVTVHPEDYPGEGPLAGVAFQRALEEAAWKAGEGRIPVQRFQDYCRNQPSKGPGEICPQMKGDYAWTNIRPIFPAVIGDSIEEAMVSFDRKIPGFAGADVVLAGVESRTSSPVRILRDKVLLESAVGGVYPCGEGAGYAGGITSAAMDGLKVAAAIGQSYEPFDKSLKV